MELFIANCRGSGRSVGLFDLFFNVAIMSKVGCEKEAIDHEAHCRPVGPVNRILVSGKITDQNAPKETFSLIC